jgi:NADPH-dependent 2,4-dienoyl-CoA reductase/sulfur reductase-like enzyme/nitrite reductase/ring-hydroxylating ferredoxin subunit
MSEAKGGPKVDLTQGVDAASLRDGDMIAGHVGDDDVLLARVDGEYFALRGLCTHYRGPLAEGLIVGDTVRCPLHHATFSLRTGEALRAPALDPLPLWRVDREGDRLFVREKAAEPPAASGPARTTKMPTSIIIVGGGAAAAAAAEMLRRRGYSGTLAMISADADLPVDRPNLSKDYLAGEAEDDWIPLWPASFYEEHRIDVVLNRRVTSIEPSAKTLRLDDGSTRSFDALLLAPGAEPVHLSIPGASQGQVMYLRTFADSRAIVERLKPGQRIVVIGASFIGLEVAASLRNRGASVDVVAPETAPLQRVMGPEIGRFVRSLHETKGVVFHLGQTVSAIDGQTVILSGGDKLQADFVIAGVGVRPAIALAEQAGLDVDRGISVNEYLETSAPGIFAAGDVARWPDPHTGDRIRVEHWVIADRQGQVAACNMIGEREPFDGVPFFWSLHYDVTIRYVGHAEKWDEIKIDGSIEDQNFLASFVRGGRTLAVATVGRDRDNLRAEVDLERSFASK